MQQTISSIVGELTVEVSSGALRAIYFGQAPEPTTGPSLKTTSQAPAANDEPIMEKVLTQLGQYFAGERKSFELPLAPQGTLFQTQAWNALCKIPYGETRSYLEQAQAMGRPSAVRAVGAANGRNPIPVIIPCHRVIGSSGKLVGYAGGLEIKSALLLHEGHLGL